MQKKIFQLVNLLELYHHIQRVLHHERYNGWTSPEKTCTVCDDQCEGCNSCCLSHGWDQKPVLSDLFKGTQLESKLQQRHVLVHPRNISVDETPSTGLVYEVDNSVEAKDDVLQKLNYIWLARAFNAP